VLSSLPIQPVSYLPMGAFHIKEMQYFSHEDDVVIPNHVLEEQQLAGNTLSTDGSLEAGDGEKVAAAP
jgi:hypothetical protein